MRRFKCECGKEYDNPQSFNGHKSHCDAHYLSKYGNLDLLHKNESNRCKHAIEIKSTHYKNQKESKLSEWISEEHKCEKCNKIMVERFGSGRFCSKECANSRVLTGEIKEKISKSLNLGKTRICEWRNKTYHTKDTSRKQCYECLPKTIKYANTSKIAKNLLDLSKRTVGKIMRRLNLPCMCCGVYIHGVVFDIHHIVAKKNGGSDDLSNLTYICPTCHRVAHTNINLLVAPLISILDYFTIHSINWHDYYYVK